MRKENGAKMPLLQFTLLRISPMIYQESQRKTGIPWIPVERKMQVSAPCIFIVNICQPACVTMVQVRRRQILEADMISTEQT